MKDKLPKDWKWVKLENVCTSASSNLSKKKLIDDNGDFPIYGASGFIKNVSFYHREEDYISIIKDGAGVGRITLLKAKSSVIGTLQYLIPKDNVDIKYLFYFLLGIDFNKYISGSTIPHIYYRHYKNENFLLIPIKEQKKIVKVLDASLGKLEQAISFTNQNIEKLKRLDASILDKIFKENNWQEDNLENVTTKIGSGSTPRGGRNAYKDTGISLVRSMNVHDNGFRVKGLAFIDDVQAKKLSNVTIEENDVLLNITGASVARCCIIPKKYIPARVNQHVSILRCKKDKLLPEFLHLCLISPYYKNKLLISSGGGATREAITKTSLVSFKIKLPSIGQQEEIVKYLANTRSKNQNLTQHYQNKLQSLQDLKKSVLDSAFKGKLKREVVKVVKEVKVIKFKELYPDSYIRKQRVAQKHKLKRRQVFTTTRIIDLHQKHNQKLGHTKTEKINHAIEYIAQCELGRDPVKNTGGPVDFYYTMQFVEPFAKEKEVFEAIPTEKGYVYNAKDNFDLFVNLSYQDSHLKPYNASIDAIINNFLFLSLREAELYMTVYTGWNNLIIRKQDVSLNSIYTESVELWIDKAEKFNGTDVKNALKWLKSKSYIPVGYGKEAK